MPLQITGGHYLVKLRWRLTGDPEEMISTLGVFPRDGLDREPVGLAQAIYQEWAHAWPAENLGNQWQFVGVDLVGPTQGGDDIVVSWDQITPGTFGEPVMPQNSALLVKKKSNLGGRKNQGRMYLPSGYLSEGGVDGRGEILNSEIVKYQGNMDEFYNAMVNGAETSPTPPRDANLEIFHNDLTTPPTLISRFIVDPRIATQRQRLRR